MASFAIEDYEQFCLPFFGLLGVVWGIWGWHLGDGIPVRWENIFFLTIQGQKHCKVMATMGINEHLKEALARKMKMTWEKGATVKSSGAVDPSEAGGDRSNTPHYHEQH